VRRLTNHTILARQRERIFDSRIARATITMVPLRCSGCALQRFWMNGRCRPARRAGEDSLRPAQSTTRLARMAPPGEVHAEIPARARDAHDLGAVPDAHSFLCDPFLPDLEHLSRPACRERDVASQGQDARLRHHVPSAVIALDGIGMLVRGLEQHVRKAALCRARAALSPPGPRRESRHPVSSHSSTSAA